MATLPANASANKSNSEKIIKSLKVKRSTSALLKRIGRETCPICLNDFNVNERVCFLGCTHMFHENCIVQWLSGKNTCPLCRRKLYQNPDHPTVRRIIRQTAGRSGGYSYADHPTVRRIIRQRARPSGGNYSYALMLLYSDLD